ncbi:hypothetical protein GCK72_015362 [Caenorhabditis remanei]|uniref:Peptidase M13 C-terminal domain-containing protein n=1 Tax=Caenorhabditis remanei TaxID=31234 RepID=A0A6A5GX26_CAERE|nr:hypothetical protein GCK72_015362 [Caenorhabditis remanei]KAF1758902.1 hypothetical protein GCK72_015362 [Caenorhabditis remanei]
MFEHYKTTEKDKKSNFSLKVFVILLVWIISVYAVVTYIRSSDEPSCKSESLPVRHKGVCKSPECITLAHQLHNWRDVSVDPCENFFKAACGKYNEHNLDPETRFNTKTGIVARLIEDMMAGIAELGRDQLGFFQFTVINQYLVISRDPIQSEDLATGIKKILNETLRLIDEKPDADQIGRDIQDVMKLNKELQEPNTNISGAIHLSTLQEHISLDFTRIIKSRIDPRRKEKVWKRIQNKTVVLIDALYYSDGKKNLETILQSSSNRTLANYLMIRFLISLEKQKTSGKDDCTGEVVIKLPLAALRMFSRNHFDKENLQIASDMVEDVIESFVETIQASSWLHETTKQRAIKKVKNMKKVIGYPKELEVPGTLDRFFESLNLSDINMTYFQTKIEIERFRTIQSMNHFAALFPFESNDRYVVANAFYHPTLNKLTLNVAFLDDPIFDSTYPKYAKVASIGETIGHEIGHGYDPVGRQRDENGEEINWWTLEDSAEYDKRSQCLINQYNEYYDPDFGRNNYCSSRSQTSLAEQLTRTHPTNSFRVNGVFSNMKSFAEAFNCPVGSPMNPEKKCQVF